MEASSVPKNEFEKVQDENSKLKGILTQTVNNLSTFSIYMKVRSPGIFEKYPPHGIVPIYTLCISRKHLMTISFRRKCWLSYKVLLERKKILSLRK